MPLQKSFSEQSRFTMRPQWQRSKSHSTAQTAASKPLAPVSESTRNKKHAFQFEVPLSKASGDAAKDANAAKDGERKNTEPPRIVKPSAPDKVNNASTPVSQYSWQDLLGVPEAQKEDENVSPSERILWRSDRTANDPPTMSPMILRKGRKRARSSSPVSSPATSKTPAAKARYLWQGLRTPRADPALELWDRFSLHGPNASPSGLTNPLLAQMMVSSSPRLPKENGPPGSDRSLRKSVSCGTNWPKRRKIERSGVEPDSISQGNLRRTTKYSMVSALLETVDDEIRKSKTNAEAEEQQLSSPSARRRSPRKTRRVAQRLSPTPDVVEDMQPVPEPSSQTVDERPNGGEKVAPAEAVSDYGDDDFDDETFMELDATINLGQGDDTTLITIEGPAPAPPAPSVSKGIEDEFGDLEDVFGDLDDDLFEGAEDLMAGIKQKQPAQVPQPPIQGQRDGPHDNVVDEDDPYGDDFGDDFDLEAIELAATQSAALSHVRTVR
ncbi:hypothetical protein B0H67DRAFT_313340 [Lasiosphaeris hirsuta]|uniref:Uncharacterized protein n=1 Tax=Lasiosphaeris hirsuta TaxID=260670 RepID=A0AA40A1C6_9PEZI|nr:hypothetical protein B0H67DRAFT_313340 [Lasiosphaeris hirsuta]